MFAHPYSLASLKEGLRSELGLREITMIGVSGLTGIVGPARIFFFLPTGSGDWSLAAMMVEPGLGAANSVTAEILANQVVPTITEKAMCQRFGSASLMADALGVDCSVLDGEGEIFAMSGVCDEEVMVAAIAVSPSTFPRTKGFEENVRAAIGAIAEQLGRSVKVNYRHIPKDQWPSSGDDSTPSFS